MIWTTYYEERHAKLINYASGEMISIYANPVWSPSESKFATVFYNDLGEGISASAIWRINNGKFVKEIEITTFPSENKSMFLEAAKWISEDEVVFSNSYEGLTCKFKNNKWSCKQFEKPVTSNE